MQPQLVVQGTPRTARPKMNHHMLARTFNRLRNGRQQGQQELLHHHPVSFQAQKPAYYPHHDAAQQGRGAGPGLGGLQAPPRAGQALAWGPEAPSSRVQGQQKPGAAAC